jgi:hypothetical protein
MSKDYVFLDSVFPEFLILRSAEYVEVPSGGEFPV